MAEPDPEVAGLLADLHEALAATEEFPLPATANRWLGEAQAVAADLDAGDPDAGTVRRRVETVQDLLSHVEATGHDEADAQVQRARELTASVLETVGDG